MSPLVSILIPCYNCSQWVHRAIETALAQTWTNKEIIVLDDGSTDGTAEAIAKFSREIRIETHANAGQNASRNRLTELSRGEWLLYLDADDELALDCVQKKMERADGADGIYGNIEVACYIGQKKTRVSIYPAVEFADPVIAAFEWRFPNTSAFIFRRDALLETAGWDTGIKNCTDYDIYFKLLLKKKKFRSVPNALSMYRQWSSTQAVYQNPLRRSRTRLQLMWSAVKEFQASDQLTPERKAAFEQAAFAVIRTIAQFDRDEARRENARLTLWNNMFRPRNCTRQYRLAYSLGGFGLAERLADWIRLINPVKTPQPGIDPQSGLPYV